MIPYETIRSELATGDIVLFAGTGFTSRLIQRATRCRWSHVAMVVHAPDLDMLALWESTTSSGLEDLRSGRAVRGVQLVPLSDRVRTYDGAIAVRRLEGVNLGRLDERQKLAEIRGELRGRPYEKSMLELAAAALEGSNGGSEDLSSLFCSELVAETYQRLGLLPGGIPSNDYSPADFSAASGMRLLKGALGPEIVLGA